MADVTPLTLSNAGAVGFGVGGDDIDYFVDTDLYRYDVDNRPLRNLAERDNVLATSVNALITQWNRLNDVSTLADRGARMVGYDNTSSGITGTTVQAAIDDLALNIAHPAVSSLSPQINVSAVTQELSVNVGVTANDLVAGNDVRLHSADPTLPSTADHDNRYYTEAEISATPIGGDGARLVGFDPTGLSKIQGTSLDVRAALLDLDNAANTGGFDTVVPDAYATPKAAIDAGHRRIFVRAGTYDDTGAGAIVLNANADYLEMVGENPETTGWAFDSMTFTSAPGVGGRIENITIGKGTNDSVIFVAGTTRWLRLRNVIIDSLRDGFDADGAAIVMQGSARLWIEYLEAGGGRGPNSAPFGRIPDKLIHVEGDYNTLVMTDVDVWGEGTNARAFVFDLCPFNTTSGEFDIARYTSVWAERCNVNWNVDDTGQAYSIFDKRMWRLGNERFLWVNGCSAACDDGGNFTEFESSLSIPDSAGDTVDGLAMFEIHSIETGAERARGVRKIHNCNYYQTRQLDFSGNNLDAMFTLGGRGAGASPAIYEYLYDYDIRGNRYIVVSTTTGGVSQAASIPVYARQYFVYMNYCDIEDVRIAENRGYNVGYGVRHNGSGNGSGIKVADNHFRNCRVGIAFLNALGNFPSGDNSDGIEITGNNIVCSGSAVGNGVELRVSDSVNRVIIANNRIHRGTIQFSALATNFDADPQALVIAGNVVIDGWVQVQSAVSVAITGNAVSNAVGTIGYALIFVLDNITRNVVISGNTFSVQPSISIDATCLLVQGNGSTVRNIAITDNAIDVIGQGGQNNDAVRFKLTNTDTTDIMTFNNNCGTIQNGTRTVIRSDNSTPSIGRHLTAGEVMAQLNRFEAGAITAGWSPSSTYVTQNITT